MKETYVQPDVQVMILAIEHNIMSNGEDTNQVEGGEDFFNS